MEKPNYKIIETIDGQDLRYMFCQAPDTGDHSLFIEKDGTRKEIFHVYAELGQLLGIERDKEDAYITVEGKRLAKLDLVTGLISLVPTTKD